MDSTVVLIWTLAAIAVNLAVGGMTRRYRERRGLPGVHAAVASPDGPAVVAGLPAGPLR